MVVKVPLPLPKRTEGALEPARKATTSGLPSLLKSATPRSVQELGKVSVLEVPVPIRPDCVSCTTVEELGAWEPGV
jgi:hypothetical protein